MYLQRRDLEEREICHRGSTVCHISYIKAIGKKCMYVGFYNPKSFSFW